jgi:hypothetical protein
LNPLTIARVCENMNYTRSVVTAKSPGTNDA